MRRTSGSALSLPASEWNRIEAPSSRVGREENRSKPIPRYTRAVGKNLSGAAIVAGSPVFYSTFTIDPDGTESSVWSPYRPGYYNLYASYLPINSTEDAALATQSCMMPKIGVVLADIPDGEPGPFAIAGIVGVKATGGKAYARPQRKTAAYQTTLAHDDWGVRVLGEWGSNYSLVNLDDFHWGDLFGKTKTGGLAAGGTGSVYYRTPVSGGWNDTTDEFYVWNPLAAIAADKVVALIWMNMRLCAFECC